VRILHAGWGFRPWRPGGLIAYAEDLMAAQVRHGHEVAYFLSGRHYPFLRRPRMHRWARDGVTMHEALNPPIVFAMERGTRDPEHDLADPWLEAAFDRVLAQERPDVVHIQELAGLPSSIIDRAHAAGVPVLMTLQDYFGLCATVRLYDRRGAVCLRREVGEECVLNNAAAPPDARPLIDRTVRFELERAKRGVPLVRRLSFARFRGVLDPAIAGIARARPGAGAANGKVRAAATPARPAAAYQRRRDENVARLRAVDRLVAPSRRVAEIYRTLGVDGDNLEVLPLTVEHLDALRPRVLDRPPRPVTFLTLGSCTSRSKGVHLVLEALRAMSAAGANARFRLLVYGHVDPRSEPELAAHPSVSIRGTFEAADLDALLEEGDVGLMTSVWEEAYPFSGLELLAKGLPLLTTPIGGIVEYAREGETAWLNHERTGAGLGRLMLDIAERPEQVLARHRTVVAARSRLIKSMDVHAGEMQERYEALGAARVT
jgi:glycosyltransferase involved in cell wall biosynthesis